VAHPPTDHDRFEYWNRSARCVYPEELKYAWDSMGRARQYERTEGRYVEREQGSLDIVPKAVRSQFDLPLTEMVQPAASRILTRP
jgi:hypothetical protein